jgi:hypothetical protein
MTNRDKRGRSKTDRFVKLPHYMLTSHAWSALSPIGRSILIEIMALYNGGNNGFLAMAARTAAQRCNCSKSTAIRALQELARLGFIEVSVEGKFALRTHHATEYRLTLYNCHRTHALPTNSFMKWRPSAAPPELPAMAPQKLFHGPTTVRHGAIPIPHAEENPTKCSSQSHDRSREGQTGNPDGPTRSPHIVYHERGVVLD